MMAPDPRVLATVARVRHPRFSIMEALFVPTMA